MSPDHATSIFSAAGRRRRRVAIGVALLSLLVGCAGFSIVEYRRASAARLREARAVAALRSLGGELEDQPTAPFGQLLPGTGAAGYRFAVRLRNPDVTDDQLALLNEFDTDRVGSLDLLNCAVGDATLAARGGSAGSRFSASVRHGTAKKSRGRPAPRAS